MKQYFINTNKGAKKFWTVEHVEKSLTILFGRLGTGGRQLIKKFRTVDEGKAALKKLTREKLRKGYTSVKSIPPVVSISSSLYQPMTHARFWALIESSLHYSNLKKQTDYLAKQLNLLSERDIVAFYNIFNALHNKAYSWNIWAAAYTVHSGCSDDSFADFRGWLITRGKKVFEHALQSSDSLVKLGKDALKSSKNGEGFLYLASTVYEDRFDLDISKSDYVKSIKMKSVPSGREWPEGNRSILRSRNPSLFNLFHKKTYTN